jgi:hypothetical protein
MTQSIALAAKIGSWLIANWKTVVLLIGANWETISLILDFIVKAQQTFVANSDKKQWVVDHVIPQVKEYTPDEVDAMIERLLDIAQMFKWLPPAKVVAG